MSSDEALPLSPTLPWSGPSDEYVFYAGPMELVGGPRGEAVGSGRIVLLVRSGSSLQWEVDFDTERTETAGAWRYRLDRDPIELGLTIEGQTEVVRAVMTGDGRGFVPGDRGWTAQAPPCVRVAATQFGLPHLFGGGEWLPRPGGGHTYRSRLEFNGWVVTLDEREDLEKVSSDASRCRLPLATHAFELRRSDGAAFNADDADDVLTGWNFGLSFAMDRWCPPVFARGYDADRQICCTEWAPLMVDPPNRGSLRWWSVGHFEDLEEFMRCWMNRWLSRDERQVRKFLITSVLAAGESAFLEQRLSTRAAALELFWVFAKKRLGVSLAENLSGQDGDACMQLRGLLEAARIDTSIPEHCTLLSAYTDEQARKDGKFDGPRAVVFVRNRLAHPNETEQLYASNGLLSEAASLAGRYLELLLLWELGYRGRAADRTKRGRWEGETERVPWLVDDTKA